MPQLRAFLPLVVALASWCAAGFVTVSAASPADYRSAHFLLHSDLPTADAQALLDRLEEQLSLLVDYWGKQARGTLELYVVVDLKNWPADAFNAAIREKIKQGAGVTLTQTTTLKGKPLGAKAVAYASTDNDSPLHESVHVYCGQTFGDTGPAWYAEGMAEVGRFWRKGEAGARPTQKVIDVLQQSDSSTPRQIADDDARTGDSWQSYARRWALCHLLAFNPNYSGQFRPLGLKYLAGEPASFDEAFAPMASGLAFEYKFFVAHLRPGFRVDLAAWDWQAKFRRFAAGESIELKLLARRGWQASGIEVSAAERLRCEARGEVVLSAGGPKITPDATPDANADHDKPGELRPGQVVGVLWNHYELGDEFAMPTDGEVALPADGRLFLRIADPPGGDWGSLSDNAGSYLIKLTSPAAPAKDQAGD